MKQSLIACVLPSNTMTNGSDRHWFRTLLLFAGGLLLLAILAFVLFLALYAWADIH